MSCGSSSSEKRRRKRPTGVRRGSSRILKSAPEASLNSSRSAWRSSAFVCMVRNFRQANGRWPMPRRIEWNRIGPRELTATASVNAISSGLSTISSSVAPRMSKVRLSAKSIPSKAGGPSSNSGTDWPGTNSARWIRISIVDGARRTRMPRRWHWSTSSTAASWGKSGSAMMTSSMRAEPITDSRSSSVPSERRPLSGSGVGERKPTTSIDACGASASAWATSAICLPRPTSTARRWKPAARSSSSVARS